MVSKLYQWINDKNDKEKLIQFYQLKQLSNFIQRDFNVSSENVFLQLNFQFYNIKKKEFSKFQQFSQNYQVKINNDNQIEILEEPAFIFGGFENPEIKVFVEIILKEENLFGIKTKTLKLGWILMEIKSQQKQEFVLQIQNPQKLRIQEYQEISDKSKVIFDVLPVENSEGQLNILNEITPHYFIELFCSNKIFNNITVNNNGFKIQLQNVEFITLQDISVQCNQQDEEKLLEFLTQKFSINQKELLIEERFLKISIGQQELKQIFYYQLKNNEEKNRLIPLEDGNIELIKNSYQKDYIKYQLFYKIKNSINDLKFDILLGEKVFQYNEEVLQNFEICSNQILQKPIEINQLVNIQTKNITCNYTIPKQEDFQKRISSKQLTNDQIQESEFIDINQEKQNSFFEENIITSPKQNSNENLNRNENKENNDIQQSMLLSKEKQEIEIKHLSSLNNEKIEKLMQTLQNERKTDKVLIQQLVDEIKSLQNEEKENKNEIFELNKKIIELSDFREQFNKTQFSYETRIKLENEDTQKNIYLEKTKFIPDFNKISLSQEIIDIQQQNFSFQILQIQYSQNKAQLINKNLYIEFYDMMNTFHRSSEIYQKKVNDKNKENFPIFDLKEITGVDKNLNFNWSFDPFKVDESYTNQFLMHYQIILRLNEKQIFIYLVDSLTFLKKAYFVFELSYFFRQGKKDQVCFQTLPLYEINQLNQENSHDDRKQIGTINIIAMNKVGETSCKQKEKFLLRTNNLNDLEIFKNNKNLNPEKKKKKIIVPKKRFQDTQNFDQKNFLEEIAKDEDKRKIFRVQRFKNNLIDTQDSINKFQIDKMKRIKEIFANHLIMRSNSILCMNNISITIPFLFTNTYQTNNFKIEIAKQNINNSKLTLISEQDQIQYQYIKLENFINCLPNDIIIPKPAQLSYNNFSLDYNSTCLVFLKFFCKSAYQKNNFVLNFLNEENNPIFSIQLVFSTVPNFIDRNLIFYENEKNVSEIKIDISQALSKIENNKTNDIFVVVSHEKISISKVQGNFIKAKFQTPPSPNKLKFLITIYENEEQENLLESIMIEIIPMQTLELLPEPGIQKQFQLLLPSDINRIVKVQSSSEKVKFENNNILSLTQSSFNKIQGKLQVLDEHEEKIMLRFLDQDSRKIVHSVILISQPKKIIPLKILNECIQKGQRKIINFNYFNKKSSHCVYNIFSSNINIIAPLEKQISIDCFKEIDVKVVIKSEEINQENEQVYLFFVEQQETVNDVYQIDIKFKENNQYQNLKIFKFKFKFKQQ